MGIWLSEARRWVSCMYKFAAWVAGPQGGQVHGGLLIACAVHTAYLLATAKSLLPGLPDPTDKKHTGYCIVHEAKNSWVIQ